MKQDCRFFVGDRPCKTGRTCEKCPEYSRVGYRILIIKLGAPGDVLRTTPLVTYLKKRFKRCQITWITEQEAAPFLRALDEVDFAYTMDIKGVLSVTGIEYDVAVNLDKEHHALGLMSMVKARKKLGFGRGGHGNIIALNPEAETLVRMGIDDELKFHINQKTYQELIFEALGFRYRGEEYLVKIPGDIQNSQEIRLKRLGLKRQNPVIGFNSGSGSVYTNKSWTTEGIIQVMEKCAREIRADILLLGGPLEERRNKLLLSQVNVPVIDTGCNNSVLEFGAIVNCCDMILTGDTFALHVAVGLKKQVIALFGPTCPQEIELYGRGRIIKSAKACAPCYRRRCDESPTCMETIKAEEVFDAITEVLVNRGCGSNEKQ